MISALPPVFDVNFYRDASADLAAMSAAELASHFDIFGRAEGRPPSPYALRENFLKLIADSADILEIGPFTNPALRGPQVKYFDVLDRDGLILRAHEHAFVAVDPPEIHFVSSTGDLSVINQIFDVVFSSHCVEHQPDLVQHLQDVHKLLRPGGAYVLIIPDKRYCFDHFIPESTLTEIVAAHLERRRVDSMRSVIEHRAFVTHNDPLRHRAGDHGELAAVRERAENAAEERRQADGSYIDVHALQFTPQSFERLVAELTALKLIELTAARVFPTPWGGFEFCAILTRN